MGRLEWYALVRSDIEVRVPTLLPSHHGVLLRLLQGPRQSPPSHHHSLFFSSLQTQRNSFFFFFLSFWFIVSHSMNCGEFIGIYWNNFFCSWRNCEWLNCWLTSAELRKKKLWMVQIVIALFVLLVTRVMILFCVNQDVVVSRHRLSTLFLSEGNSFTFYFFYDIFVSFSFVELIPIPYPIVSVCLLILCFNFWKEREDSARSEGKNFGTGSQSDDKGLKHEVFFFSVTIIIYCKCNDCSMIILTCLAAWSFYWMLRCYYSLFHTIE